MNERMIECHLSTPYLLNSFLIHWDFISPDISLTKERRESLSLRARAIAPSIAALTKAGVPE